MSEVLEKPAGEVSDEELLKLYKVEQTYSTREASWFFNRSQQWLYYNLRNGRFTDLDGNPIDATRIGKGKRRRFTLDNIKEIAMSAQRRGTMSKDELLETLRKIYNKEHGI